jgi:sarcosine oxidase/L-pipecolate oxidase
VIVGAGIVGSCTAYHLARRGRRVVLLEQFDFGHARGSSHGESRIIRRTYPEAYYAAMMPTAYDLWCAAEVEFGQRVITTTGGLDFGSPELLGELAKACAACGVEHQFLDRAELAARFPTVKLPAGQQVVYSPESGSINARKACVMFQQLARAHGATLVDRTRAISLRHLASGQISLGLEAGGAAGGGSARRELVCGQVVLCAGPWTAKLLQRLTGHTIATRVAKVTVAYWRVAPAHADAYAAGRFPLLIDYSPPGFYGLPVLEFPGLLKMCIHDGATVDPDARDFEADRDGLRKVGAWIDSHLEGVDGSAPARTESCLYTFTNDEDFIIDRLLPGVVVAAGFSGHGFKLAPCVGLAVADIVEDGRCTRFDMAPFRIRRAAVQLRPTTPKL